MMNNYKEFRNFLGIANGSSNELATQLLISVKIWYIKVKDLKSIFELITEIQKINFTLIKKFSNI